MNERRRHKVWEKVDFLWGLTCRRVAEAKRLLGWFASRAEKSLYVPILNAWCARFAEKAAMHTVGGEDKERCWWWWWVEVVVDFSEIKTG